MIKLTIFLLIVVNCCSFLKSDDADCKSCEKLKFTSHYRFRKCEPIMRKDCPKCVQSYQCPEVIKPKLGTCEYNGKFYSAGDLIDVDDPCRKCYCRDGESSVEHCVFIECPKEAFGIPPYPPKYLDEVNRDEEFEKKYKNCYYYHQVDQCCGKSVCPAPNEVDKIKKCVYRNTTFMIGERYYPEEDKCMACICSEDYDPKNVLKSQGCHEVKCGFSYQKLIDGCIPIYWVTGCCPIDYYCPMNKKSKSKICKQKPHFGYCEGDLTRYYFDASANKCRSFKYSGCGGSANSFETFEECQKFCLQEEKTSKLSKKDLNKCHFDGNSYNLSETLDIGDKSVKCTCRTPPDFTCIKSSEDEMMM